MNWNKIDEQQIPLNTDVVIIDKLNNYWVGRFKFHKYKSIEDLYTYDINWEYLIEVNKEILIEPEDVVYWIELPSKPTKDEEVK
jgi:hypothetical protein